MDKLQQWVALTVAGSLALLAAGWFLVISPKKDRVGESAPFEVYLKQEVVIP